MTPDDDLVAALRAAAEEPEQVEHLAAVYLSRHPQRKPKPDLPWSGWRETLGWVMLFGFLAALALGVVWLNFHPEHAAPGSDPWGWEGWAAWLCGLVGLVAGIKLLMLSD